MTAFEIGQLHEAAIVKLVRNVPALNSLEMSLFCEWHCVVLRPGA
jgi:hypothetical protein